MAGPRMASKGIGTVGVLKLVFGAIIGTLGGLFCLGLVGVLAESGIPRGPEAGDTIAAIAILGVLALGGLIGGALLFASGLKPRKGWTPPPPPV